LFGEFPAPGGRITGAGGAGGGGKLQQGAGSQGRRCRHPAAPARGGRNPDPCGAEAGTAAWGHAAPEASAATVAAQQRLACPTSRLLCDISILPCGAQHGPGLAWLCQGIRGEPSLGLAGRIIPALLTAAFPCPALAPGARQPQLRLFPRSGAGAPGFGAVANLPSRKTQRQRWVSFPREPQQGFHGRTSAPGEIYVTAKNKEKASPPKRSR